MTSPLRLFASLLLLGLLSPLPVRAEKVDMPPEALRKTATHVVVGAVRAIYERKGREGDWLYTRRVAEIAIEAVEKDDASARLEPGTVIHARYWTRRYLGREMPPSTTGHRGIPSEGDRVRAYLARNAYDGFGTTKDGGYNVIGANGFETPAPKREKTKVAIGDLTWLTGTWRNEAGPMPFEEIWSAPWGGTMTAMSRGLSREKTVMVELSSIEPSETGLVLHLRHFHDGLEPWEGETTALRWQLEEAGARRAVFRNPDRPFPREVVYERRGDTLLATLRGVRGDEEAEVVFELKRVPEAP